MKFTKYILSLLVLICAVSCTIDDELKPTKDNGDKIQLVTRVVPFNEYDILTRATGEDVINSIDYFIFAKVGNTGNSSDYLCVFYRHSTNQTIAIDCGTDFKDIIANNASGILQNCQIVILANYPKIEQIIAETAKSLGYGDNVESFMDERVLYKGTGDIEDYISAEFFRSIAFDVPESVGIPATGLPRMGEYENSVDLRPDADISGDIYPVNLQSLYAKMVFDISVKATQSDVTADETGNRFDFTGFKVHNLVKSLDMVGGNESTEGGNEGTNDATSTYSNVIDGELIEYEETNRHTTFTFYLPERYLQAHESAKNHQYPFGKSPNIRKEDSVLLQRYKPLLVTDTVNKPKATFVRFSGIYTNHQGHTYEVSYDIYVGNDNYSNFDVVRNRQYNNTITIKGIETSKDQSNVQDAVSIDHRVTVNRTTPIIINFRRETMLDSHFEIRPLRIGINSKHNNQGGNITGTVKVEVLTYKKEIIGEGEQAQVIETIGGASGNERPDWIRLERSYGDGKTVNTTYYCHNGELGASSNGKRKYFTYGLVSGKKADGSNETTGWTINDKVSVEVPLSDLNPNIAPDPAGCVWVYVDECLEWSDDIESVRQAVVRVTYDGDTTDYVVNQHRLYRVVSSEGEYYIEHEEEYLHNFDADDKYGQNDTEFEGMEWGLYNTRLSFINRALFIDMGWGDIDLGLITISPNGILNDLIRKSGLQPYYDFYVQKHDGDLDGANLENGLVVYNRVGLDFFKKIVNDINGAHSTGYSARENSGRENNIKKLQLDQLPHSAIEYCYNRNKRNSDGTINTNNITWYLPAIDEMEDIMTVAFGKFLEFQEQFYWSCQPSYVKSYVYYNIGVQEDGDFYSDDFGIYEIGNNSTTTKNVGRARATRAVFIGPEIDNFIYSESASNGYDNAYEIGYDGITWSGIKSTLTSYYKGSYKNNNLKDWTLDTDDGVITYDEGNQLRSEKNRVRALVDKTKVKPASTN